MKNILLLYSLVFILCLSSCKKSNSSPNPSPTSPDYVGTYINNSAQFRDTSYVTVVSANLIRINWRAKSGVGKFDFDSVVVLPNLSFTDNELLDSYGVIHHSVGSGQFLPQTMNFNFLLDGSARIIFDGIKQ